MKRHLLTKWCRKNVIEGRKTWNANRKEAGRKKWRAETEERRKNIKSARQEKYTQRTRKKEDIGQPPRRGHWNKHKEEGSCRTVNRLVNEDNNE